MQVPGYLRDTEGTRRELAGLQGSIHHVDTQVGRLLARGIRQLGLEQRTLVIFTTDHGIAMPRAKCALYDPGTEVAFLLRLPSRPGWHGGKVHGEMISNVDYLPTILDLVGVPIPRGPGPLAGPLVGRQTLPGPEGSLQRAYVSRLL